jgi:hypothetical protein
MARRYLDQEGRQLRDTYDLKGWFGSDAEIRERYFAEIAHTVETLQTDEGAPPDATVVKMLANMCESDPSFESHVLNKNTVAPPWKELRETGAAVAFEAFIREVEAATWP